MENLTKHAKKAVELFYINRSEAIKHLAEILRVTYLDTSKLKEVEKQHAGVLGRAYIHLLDCIDDSKYFQTLSTLGYYFSSKAIEYNPTDIIALEGRIIGLNLGARSFYRTIASALNMSFSIYVDFSDIQTLPTYVKYVLMLEYWSLSLLENCIPILPNDMLMRKSWLNNMVENGYFNSICDDLKDNPATAGKTNNFVNKLLNSMMQKKSITCVPATIERKAIVVHNDIMKYVESKILNNNLDFNKDKLQTVQYDQYSDPDDIVF